MVRRAPTRRRAFSPVTIVMMKMELRTMPTIGKVLPAMATAQARQEGERRHLAK